MFNNGILLRYIKKRILSKFNEKYINYLCLEIILKIFIINIFLNKFYYRSHSKSKFTI